MYGNLKSLKIDNHKDQYGRVVYNRHDLYEMLYDGEDISSIEEVDWHEDFKKYNYAVEKNHLSCNLFKEIEKLSIDIDAYDRQNQSEWFMPDEYKDLDIEEWLFAKVMKEKQHAGVDFVYNSAEWMRVEEELEAYKERSLIPVLRYMIYLVDTMRENNIVWGVGRGSSVASYVLYIIGIHRINSIAYNLDWREFLRG